MINTSKISNPIAQRLIQTAIFVLFTYIGGKTNMAIVNFGPKIIPYPNNIDPANFEMLKATIPQFQPKHFLSPFLAHALGTFVSALGISLFIGDKKSRTFFAYLAALLFFIGGSMAVNMLPAPMWFNITDLALAYFPMAYIALKINQKED